MLLLLVRADELQVDHPKRGRQPIEAHDRRVAPALLKPAYALLAEAGELCQLFLRQTFLLPDSFYVPASDPKRIGSDQVRGVRFEGERMVLIPPPRRTGEIEEHREITWERIAAE
jgi:hypothetical protein